MCNLISKNFPKILVIDHSPFNRTHNNGIVKSNLFQDWPKDRLAQILYSGPFPSFDVCSHYWEIQKRDVLKGILRIAPKRQALQETSQNEVVSIADRIAKKKG